MKIFQVVFFYNLVRPYLKLASNFIRIVFLYKINFPCRYENVTIGKSYPYKGDKYDRQKTLDRVLYDYLSLELSYKFQLQVFIIVTTLFIYFL